MCRAEDEVEPCWICLEGDSPDKPLEQVCTCPHRVHRACLARWQLQSAGRSEENKCRFCANPLPDWRPALTPENLQPVSSIMSVRYRGTTYRLVYRPGPDGLAQFLKQLQAIGIKVASASQVTFLCRSPDTGDDLALKGLQAFDAAAYCASITAAKRLADEQSKDVTVDASAQSLTKGALRRDTTEARIRAVGMPADLPAFAPAPAAAPRSTLTPSGGGGGADQQQHAAAQVPRLQPPHPQQLPALPASPPAVRMSRCIKWASIFSR